MRVFNISLHKTATSSMQCALGLLGFNSSARPDLFIPYMDGRIEECSCLFEDNIAISDMPIPLMYIKLSELFPNAKFILIRRELEAWLDSFRRHLTRYPYALNSHTCLYGYPISLENFREDVCRRAWKRHHEEVEAFFSGSPNFLSLPLHELSWKPICKFLDREVPVLEFPYINVDTHKKRHVVGKQL